MQVFVHHNIMLQNYLGYNIWGIRVYFYPDFDTDSEHARNLVRSYLASATGFRTDRWVCYAIILSFGMVCEQTKNSC